MAHPDVVLTPRPRLQSRRYRRRHCWFSCLGHRTCPPWYAQSAAANLVRAEPTWPKFQRSSSRSRRMPEELSTEFMTSRSGLVLPHHPSWWLNRILVAGSDPLTLRRTALATVRRRAPRRCSAAQRIHLATFGLHGDRRLALQDCHGHWCGGRRRRDHRLRGTPARVRSRSCPSCAELSAGGRAVEKQRPLGQNGGPARPGECRAHPSAPKLLHVH